MNTLPGLPLLSLSARRWRRVALIAVLVILTLGYADYINVFDALEGIATGARLQTYATRHEPLAQRARRQIVLVLLADESFRDAQFSHLSGPPLPRSFHAKLVRELARGGAKVIVFDFVFDLPREQDTEFAAAVREAGHSGTRVLWACLSEGEPPRLLLPNETLRAASRFIGHTRVLENRERPVVDRVEPALEWNGKAVPALSFEAARLALGVENQPLRDEPGAWRSGFFSVPVERDGAFKINFFGAAGEAFPDVPYEDIYGGAVEDEFYKRNRFFKDKIVLVGDTTTVSRDRRPTPQGQMSGVEINAHAVATLLQQGFIREAPLWVNFGALGVLVLAVCAVVSFFSLGRAVMGVFALFIGYFVLNVWLFVDFNFSFHLIAPLLAGLLAATGVLAERGLLEEREKSRMRTLFERSVSPQIADYIARHPEKCVLGQSGEHVNATILFSDIRGFTSLSEQITPDELVARLNEYFQAMTDVVFRHDGATARFVGDAMMAMFGVPIPHPDHARRAVAAALDMQTEILRLQNEWREKNLPIFDIGIGLNTGEMVAGVVGAHQRLDFTVHGPAVNIASRVESFNKEFGTRILITATTYESVKDEVLVRGPFSASAKGVSEDVIVYELCGWKEAVPVADSAPVLESGSGKLRAVC